MTGRGREYRDTVIAEKMVLWSKANLIGLLDTANMIYSLLFSLCPEKLPISRWFVIARIAQIRLSKVTNSM